MEKKKNKEEIIKVLFLSLITIAILTSVYHFNSPKESKEDTGNDYLKSEICYYALNGIVADHHYHLQLNITIVDERI